ncbi:HpcH/HpaI aldolase/citrate lyase family protein [Natrialbaceae archaeon A-gly3]
MVRRSVMFTPGDREEMLYKAPDTGADVVVFDVEDAVAVDRKAEARETVRGVLSDPSFDPDCEVCVRVNPVGFGGTDDIDAVLGEGAVRLDSVMLPKTESGTDVETLVGHLSGYDAALPVLALVESARGILAADEIAAVDATDALVFGAEDLAADVGATRTADGLEVLYARERTVLAAAANDVEAIDTVYTDFEDREGLLEDTAVAIELGYDGKMAIHPSQVEPINDAFTPDPDELEWARSVLEGKREADADGRGVFEIDGEMIDAPLIAQAERIVERADAADDHG